MKILLIIQKTAILVLEKPQLSTLARGMYRKSKENRMNDEKTTGEQNEEESLKWLDFFNLEKTGESFFFFFSKWSELIEMQQISCCKEKGKNVLQLWSDQK